MRDDGTMDRSGTTPQGTTETSTDASREAIRPSEIYDFDEILPTLNTPRDSFYFASKNEFYTVGMLFIKCPYSDGLGSIRGIVEILMPLYLEGKETLK